MEELFVKLQERKRRETLPFIPIFESYSALVQLSDDLQRRLQEADQEILLLRHKNDEHQSENNNSGKSTPSSVSTAQSKTLTTALRNETRLREKLEHLEEAYDAKLKSETTVRAEATSLTAKLREMESVVASQKATIQELSAKVEHLAQKSTKLSERCEESELNRSLAEQQNEGLKQTIRTLQEDNQALKKENASFGDRLVTDKEKMVNELNQLNEVIGKLEKENQELRAMEKQNQEERKKAAAAKSSAWFGVFGAGASGGGDASAEQQDELSPSSSSPTSPTRSNNNSSNSNIQGPSQYKSSIKEMVVICPSHAQKSILAHANEGTCLRFDRHDSTIFATASIGGSVKTWNATTGASCSVFYCVPGQSILSCDVSRSMVAGAGTDKTCRVWDTTTNRMVRYIDSRLLIACCCCYITLSRGLFTAH
jgi:WD40 repeat protein